MRIYRYLLFLMIAFSACGCTSLVLIFAGMRQPKEESHDDIKQYLLKFGQDTNETYILRDSAAYGRLQNDPLFREIMGDPVIYSKKGKIRQLRDSSSCQWSTAGYLGRLRPDSAYEVIPVKDWDLILQDIVPFSDGGAPPSFDTNRYDFLIIYSWAIFMHKYNERQFLISKAAAENHDSRIKVIPVNIDVQKSWDLSKDKWIRLKLDQ
jgi:hypothetical protein